MSEMEGQREKEQLGYPAEMVADARELYFKYKGGQFERIEREMKLRGWMFYRELLNKRPRRSEADRPGWPELYGWDKELAAAKAVSKKRKRKTPAKREFENWLKETFPEWHWTWAYQKYLYEKLAAITEGKCKRLMIFMPPRHGKSETVTVRYTAWRLLRDPKLNVILGSYNQRLADRFSRKIKRVVDEGGLLTAETPRSRGELEQDAQDEQDATESSSPRLGVSAVESGTERTRSLPLPVLTRRLKSVSEWETLAGGAVRSVGAGAGIAGFGAGLIVIDDPVRNRADANSEAYRDRVWDWFNDDVYTRLEPNGAIILIQTRWHEDDLAGRLLREMEDGGEKWEVINLPAIAMENDQLGREPGKALCQQRFGIKALERIKTKLGSHSFSALYQQEPMPSKGAMFKREWFKQIVDVAPPHLRWKRGYDLAISMQTSADFTASFRCAFDARGNLYIADGFRKKLEYPDQRRFIIERMQTERGTEHGIESAMHGTAIVQELRRDPAVRRYAFRAVRVDEDKLTRALAWLNRAEAGKVFLVRGPWIDEFVEEVCRFPSGKHDDQVDAVSIAVGMLDRNTSGQAWGF